MSLLGSVARFVASIFGLAEGSTERATDKLLTSSPDAIRAQFRKTQEDKKRDYKEMAEAIAELAKIKDEKQESYRRLANFVIELDTKKAGAVAEYKRTQNEVMREEFARISVLQEETAAKMAELQAEIVEQTDVITTYMGRLAKVQQEIQDLKKEEAETVADIVSSRKMQDLSNKLSGMASDTQSKNLEALRDARKKAKAVARIGHELSGATQVPAEDKLMLAGKAAKHLDVFDEAVKLDRLFVQAEVPKALPPPPNQDAIDALRNEVRQMKQVARSSGNEVADAMAEIYQTQKRVESQKFAEKIMSPDLAPKEEKKDKLDKLFS